MTCEDCEKDIMLWLEDGTGFCYVHAIEYCQEEMKKQEFQEQTGISELDIIQEMMKSKISMVDAKAKLQKESEAVFNDKK